MGSRDGTIHSVHKLDNEFAYDAHKTQTKERIAPASLSSKIIMEGMETLRVKRREILRLDGR